MYNKIQKWNNNTDADSLSRLHEKEITNQATVFPDVLNAIGRSIIVQKDKIPMVESLTTDSLDNQILFPEDIISEEALHCSVVVDFLFIVTPIVGVCNCSMFCCSLLCVHFSIAIILMGKRELIALLNLSSWCLVMVERLFLTVPRGCLQFVIVVFPDHTHLLF